MTDSKKKANLITNHRDDFSHSENDSATSDQETKSPAVRSSRRSKRLNKNASEASSVRLDASSRRSNEDAHEIQAKASKKKASKKIERSHLTSLKSVVQEEYNYTLKEQDIEFLKIYFGGLPRLDDTWSRIGFNQETQTKRRNTLYDKITVDFTEMVEGEEDLEDEIKENIETLTKKAKKYSVELSIKFDESKLNKLATILQKDEWITKECARLDKERERRLDELDDLIELEAKLCQRLKMKTSDKIRTVPSLEELAQLANRVRELEVITEQRTQEMNKLRDEITRLYQDLDISRSDSFVEGIIYESSDEFPLSEENISRAKDFNEYLVQKDASLTNEIRTIRFKIKELWQKLNIDNGSVQLKHFILTSPLELTSIQLDIEMKKLKKTKKQLFDLLEQEYEECVKVKMANMQKFIDTVRVEIRKLCEQMFYGPKDMKRLNDDLLASTDYTEELLQHHEEKLEDLKFKYEESASLYEKTAKWLQLWADFVQFEEITKDPTRLTKRGYSTLDEARKRTAFEKQLPKLVEEITKLADEYAQLNGGTSFTIHDLYFSEYIERKRVDHEESKQAERKEKQIMKDQIKKNESRFGVSKIKTPLRAKRKNPVTAVQQQETMLNTPSSRHSKMLKTDQSTLCGTPGLSSTRAGPSAAHATAALKPKLTVYDKMKGRKSKTPGKSTRKSLNKRKSRQMKAAAAAAAAAEADSNDTLVSDTTMKTSIVSSFASTNTTRSNITNSTTNVSHSTTNSSRFNFSHGLQTKSKCPPLSSSSKFSSLQQIMTSTASNSMIEENVDDFENIEHSTINTAKNSKAKLLAEATARLNRGSSSTTPLSSSKFNFKYQQSNSNLKYDEFSRDLNKTSKGLFIDKSNY